MQLKGLYLIADAALLRPGHPEKVVAQAVESGVALVQYRDNSDDGKKRRRAAALQAVCENRGAAFIINDDVELAHALNAGGVHLGVDDTPVAEARRRLGRGKIIGASCYASLERALRAQRDGADYVAFGSVFASPTKPQAGRITLDALREYVLRVSVPVCAIGGIQPHNVGAVAGCGVAMVAAASGILAADDPKQAVAKYLDRISRGAARITV